MTLNEFIEDAFSKEHEFLMDAVRDLTPEELAWRPGHEANPMGWILWHMLRVEDMWFQFFIQRQPEIWESEGWNEKFGLPTRDNGFGHTQEQVDGFPAVDLTELILSGNVVRDDTLANIKGLVTEDYDVVTRELRPEMSVGAIFRQVSGEGYQRQGDLAYLKGMAHTGGMSG